VSIGPSVVVASSEILSPYRYAVRSLISSRCSIIAFAASTASDHRLGSSKWSKVRAANWSTSKLFEEAIQVCKRQLFWRCDLYPDGLAIGCEIDDQAPANLACSDTLLSSAALEIEVRRECSALTVRYF